MQEIPIKSLTRNENPLKKLDRIDKPLTIKQDQQEKQVINTIREVPPEMYTPAHLLIPPQDKLSLFRKHIPKQQEIDTLLKNLRKCMLHNLMVNLDTKDLIESYTKSLNTAKFIITSQTADFLEMPTLRKRLQEKQQTT